MLRCNPGAAMFRRGQDDQAVSEEEGEIVKSLGRLVAVFVLASALAVASEEPDETGDRAATRSGPHGEFP